MLTRRIGRRGVVLALFGAAFVVYGFRLINITDAFLPPLPIFSDPQLWGWMWLAVGAACLVSALVRVGWDGVGFVLSITALTLWTASYAAGAMIGDQPTRSFAAGAFCAVFALILATVAGWPEVRR